MLYTFQDLLAVGDTDKDRAEFVLSAINNHKNSKAYETAKNAEEYAAKRNVTINQFQKLLYTVSGKVVPDNFSANFKLASGHFDRFTTQQVQYLLGNGTSWGKVDTADKLGTRKYSWDDQLQEAGLDAIIEGVAFGFWNLDHIDVFKLTEFAPLFDEDTGALMAGIRFWQLAESKPLRATLYEIDGYTDYKWENGTPYIVSEKTPYKLNVVVNESGKEKIVSGENYDGFPIVPLWANRFHQSELVGIREQIDCYDLIKSGFANNVDEASFIYWTIQNAGGMDDIDLVKFVEHMKTIKAAVVEDGGARAESHTMDVPYESREKLLDRLQRDMYRDYMALDTDNIANGAVTATQIKAAYEPINSKADRFEYQVLKFIDRILELANIDDKATFTRSIMVNSTEDIQTIISAATYLDADYVTQKIMEILGDSDKVEEVINKMNADNMQRIVTEEE